MVRRLVIGLAAAAVVLATILALWRLMGVAPDIAADDSGQSIENVFVLSANSQKLSQISSHLRDLRLRDDPIQRSDLKISLGEYRKQLSKLNSADETLQDEALALGRWLQEVDYLLQEPVLNLVELDRRLNEIDQISATIGNRQQFLQNNLTNVLNAWRDQVIHRNQLSAAAVLFFATVALAGLFGALRRPAPPAPPPPPDVVSAWEERDDLARELALRTHQLDQAIQKYDAQLAKQKLKFDGEIAAERAESQRMLEKIREDAQAAIDAARQYQSAEYEKKIKNLTERIDDAEEALARSEALAEQSAKESELAKEAAEAALSAAQTQYELEIKAWAARVEQEKAALHEEIDNLKAALIAQQNESVQQLDQRFQGQLAEHLQRQAGLESELALLRDQRDELLRVQAQLQNNFESVEAAQNQASNQLYQLKALADQAPVGLLHSGDGEIITYANAVLLHWLGLDQMPENLADILSENDRDQIAAALAAHLDGGSASVAVNLLGASGTSQPLMARCVPMVSGDGDILGSIVAFYQDVQDPKQIADLEQARETAEARALELEQAKAAAEKERDFAEAQMVENEQALVVVRAQLLELEKQQEQTLQLMRQIQEEHTETRDQAAKAQLEKERLQNILDHAPVGVAVIGVGKVPVYHNFWMVQRHGQGLGHWLTQGERLAPDMNRPAIHQMIDGRFLALIRQPFDDGRILWVEADADAAMQFAEIQVRKEQELKEESSTAPAANATNDNLLEPNTAQIDSNEAAKASEFLAVMCHEIRTPMAGIKGIVDLLSNTQLDQRQQRYVRTAGQSIQALMRIVNDVLDLSKMEANRLELSNAPFNLPEHVQGVMELLSPRAQLKGLEFSAHIDPQLSPWLIGDGGRLRQILLNLIGNAIKFTSEGSVRVEVEPIAKRGNAFDSDEMSDDNDQWLIIRVIDTGAGIAADQRDRLFKRFSQVRQQPGQEDPGTGLGLAICKMLVELMGGEIGVESEVGVGSQFWATLRLGVAPAEVQTSMDEVQVPPPAVDGDVSSKVLLVEDNNVVRMVMTEQLESLGHRVTAVICAGDALKALQAQVFDVVFMDINLPDFDGLEATKRIRAMAPPAGLVKIIALTAHAMREDETKCLAAGMDGYLAKPVSPAQVQAKINQVLGEKKSQTIETEDSKTDDEKFEFHRPSAMEVIDEAALEQLLSNLGPAKGGQLLIDLIEDVEHRSAAILKALENEDFDRLAREAHLLKGSAGSMNAGRLFDAIEKLVTATREGTPDQVMELAPEIVAPANELAEHLKRRYL